VRHGICQCVSCQRRFAAFPAGDPPREERFDDPLSGARACRARAGRPRRAPTPVRERQNPNRALLLPATLTWWTRKSQRARPAAFVALADAGESTRWRATCPDRPVSVRRCSFWTSLPFQRRAAGDDRADTGADVCQRRRAHAYILGHTGNQPDWQELSTLAPMQFHQANERWYNGMRARRVAGWAPDSPRMRTGLRQRRRSRRHGRYAPAESHLPFDVLPDASWRRGRGWAAGALPGAGAQCRLSLTRRRYPDRFRSVALVATLRRYQTRRRHRPGSQSLQLAPRCWAA
jgi:hypothetical protein